MESVKHILQKQLQLVEIEIGQINLNMFFDENKTNNNYLESLMQIKENLEKTIKIMNANGDINILPQ